MKRVSQSCLVMLLVFCYHGCLARVIHTNMGLTSMKLSILNPQVLGPRGNNAVIRSTALISHNQKKTVLLIGDSIVEGLYRMLYWTHSIEMAYIKSWAHVDRTFHIIIPNTEEIRRKFDVVLWSPGYFHSLGFYRDEMPPHIARIFWEGLRLLYRLEGMILQEIDDYKTVSKLVVVLIPSPICSDQYNGDYQQWMQHQEIRLEQCGAAVRANASYIRSDARWGNATYESVYGVNISSKEGSYQFCRDSQFNYEGAFTLANRVRSFCESHDIPYFDMYAALKEVNCTLHCPDARHFDDVALRTHVARPLLDKLQLEIR